MRRELLELRTKLSKQESLLQSTAERLKTANQQKESMEQFIFSQCGCPRARGWERKLGKGGGLPDCPLVLQMDGDPTDWRWGVHTDVMSPNLLCPE